MAHSGGGSESPSAGWKKLTSTYRPLFVPEAHDVVEGWYNTRSSKEQRHAFKSLIKDIQSIQFDAVKASLKATYDPDITTANAILLQHGGDLMTPGMSKKTAEWLSVAHPAKVQLFRETFGLIRRPSKLCVLRHTEDMNPQKSIVEVETSLVPKRKLVAREHLHPTSHMREYPQSKQAGNRTAYQQDFVWKTSSVPLAYCQRAKDRREEHLFQRECDERLVQSVQAHMSSGATTAFILPAELYQSSMRLDKAPHTAATSPSGGGGGLYTPFGVLDTGNIDRTQWESLTHDQFKRTYFLEPQEGRSHQNLNDNYSRMVYLQRRKQRKLRQASLAASQPHQQDAVDSVYSGTASGTSTQRGAALSGAVTSLTGSRRGGVDEWLHSKITKPVSVIFPSI